MSTSLTDWEISFLSEFVTEGLRLRDRPLDFLSFAPCISMCYRSDGKPLTDIAAKRIRKPQELSDVALDQAQVKQFMGLGGELANLHLFRLDLDAFVQQFNQSLPDANGNGGGDPGYDFIYESLKIDSKTTVNTYNAFSFPIYFESVPKKCDIFVFNRWETRKREFVTLGFATYEAVQQTWKRMQNPKTGRWFLDVSLERLYDAGLLSTNIYKLIKFPDKFNQ